MKMLRWFLQLYSCMPRWMPTILVAALIAYLTLVPRPLGDTELSLFPGADKVVHFIMFGTLSFAMCLDWSHRRGDYHGGYKPVAVWLVLLFAVIGSVTGGVVEMLQDSMGLGRSADWYDELADTLGAFAGALTAGCVASKASKVP